MPQDPVRDLDTAIELRDRLVVEPEKDPGVRPRVARSGPASVAELERIIRDGVRPESRSTWGMQSASFYHLSDADVAAMIAFIRS